MLNIPPSSTCSLSSQNDAITQNAQRLPVAAVYLRYSTDSQKATSLDDQLRNCLNLAKLRHYHVPEALVFSDAAISGATGVDARAGYQAFLNAWAAGSFEAVIVDEISRLARDDVEHAQLRRRVETTGVRLMTVDGLDSADKNWTLLAGLKGLLSVEALKEYSHRTRRGMFGAVVRGYSTGSVPFGYKGVKELDGLRVVGTRIEVDEETAPWVRSAFSMRAAGKSLNEICRYFNEGGAPARSGKPGVRWVPAMLTQLFGQTMYAGYIEYPVRDETTGQTRRERFEREHLRLVSDEVFRLCKPGPKLTAFTPIRGGVRHWAAGLVSCGVCGTALTFRMSPTRTHLAMQCMQCSIRKTSGILEFDGRPVLSQIISVEHVEQCLIDVLQNALTDEVAAAFRARLQERLTGGADVELEQARAELHSLQKARARLLRLLSSAGSDDLALEREYKRLRDEEADCARRVARLSNAPRKVDAQALQRQLEAGPADVLVEMLETAEPSAVGARLRSVFSSITYESKLSRSVCELAFVVRPGALAASLTGTRVLDAMSELTMRYRSISFRKSDRTVGYKFERLA